MRAAVRALIALATLGVAATAASADPDAARLFREGRALLRRGQVAAACERFADSERLDPSVGTLLNLGDCRERMGQLAAAWSVFRDAQALAEARRDRRGAEAGRRADLLGPRLAYLTAQVATGPPGMVVRVDGNAVDPDRWDRATALDPGDHTLDAAAPGHVPWSTTLHLVAGQRTVVPIALATVPNVAAPVEAIPVAATTVATPPARAAIPLRHLGVGLAAGANHREVPIAGVRATAGLAMPGGALRGTASVRYSRHDDASVEPVEHTTTISVAVGADYLWAPLPQLALAAGVGLGFDRDAIRAGTMTTADTGAWWMLHASPLVVRALAGHLELGLHVEIQRAGDEWTGVVLAAADVMIR